MPEFQEGDFEHGDLPGEVRATGYNCCDIPVISTIWDSIGCLCAPMYTFCTLEEKAKSWWWVGVDGCGCLVVPDSDHLLAE